MPLWPSDGQTDWNAAMKAYLAIGHGLTGRHKVYSAYTDLDSEDNAMLKSHAYKAAANGVVYGYGVPGATTSALAIWVGTTDDPYGAGDKIQSSACGTTTGTVSVCAHVAKDEYFELRMDTNTVTIRWKTLKEESSAPVDQD